jgi:hypothetical protein
MTHLNNDNDVTRLDTPLITPSEAAQLLASSRVGSTKPSGGGTLPCLRIGRHIRFTPAMLEDWLRGRMA